ncbi:MAG: ROK family protein [Clostridia bacterium]|nr:ROK family protein [Clostridia bacterium]
MNYRIGIDIGGTSAKLGVVDEAFHIVERAKVKTGKEFTADDILEAIAAAARPLCEQYGIETVGVGSPGRVNPDTGVVERSGNLPFSHTPVAPKLSALLGRPVFLDNDAKCAMRGEQAAGACKGMQNALLLTIGTGLGGAILIDGKIYRGVDNLAGELGHFVMDMNDHHYRSGDLYGCFEGFASASALVWMARPAIEAHPDSVLAKMSREGLEGRTLFDAMAAGCPVAKDVLTEYGRRFALGVDSLSYIFRPQVIVLSGGLSKAGQTLLDLIAPHRVTDTPLALTTLFGDGGLIGASLLGIE